MRARKKPHGLVSLDILILFVAIMIVVGIVGVVLITTGSTLQQTTLTKADQREKDVSGGLEPIRVYGHDPSIGGYNPHKLTYLFITLRPYLGTQSLNLNTTLIILESSGNPQAISLNTTCAGTTALCNASSTTHYMVFYEKQGERFEAGYINRGDVATVVLKPETPIGEDIEFRIMILPAAGPSTMIDVITPATMIRRNQVVWPIA
jgi:archaellin